MRTVQPCATACAAASASTSSGGAATSGDGDARPVPHRPCRRSSSAAAHHPPTTGDKSTSAAKNARMIAAPNHGNSRVQNLEARHPGARCEAFIEETEIPTTRSSSTSVEKPLRSSCRATMASPRLWTLQRSGEGGGDAPRREGEWSVSTGIMRAASRPTFGLVTTESRSSHRCSTKKL